MSTKIEIGPYSAYAIAVKYGYTGTEEEWIAAVENDRKRAEAAAAKVEQMVTDPDKTLTKEGIPADAKAVGDALGNINLTWDAITGKPSSYPAYVLANQGTQTAVTGPLDGLGMTLHQVYANGYPTSYGNVLSIHGSGDSELLTGWSGSNNGIERLYYRNRRDMCATWSSWSTVAYLSDLYPVGSIYMSTSSTSPASLFGGSWESIASERVLMGVSGSHGAGSTVSAGLPNITGTFSDLAGGSIAFGGALSASTPQAITQNFRGGSDSAWGWNYVRGGTFNAARSSSIYGNSSTVQPAAYYVYIWRRTA